MKKYWWLVLAFVSCVGAEEPGILRPGVISAVPSFSEDFSGPVDTKVWNVAGWVEHNGQTSPSRCYAKDGYLNMEFVYDTTLTPANRSSAIETRGTFLYGRWEARLKPSSVTGVLNSFYTIDWGNGAGTKQEIDIEFLTFAFGPGAGKVHYAVHEAGSTSFDTNPDVPLTFNPSDDFHIYGFEITPEKIQWIVDGKVMKSYTYLGNPITIDSPYQLKLNTWSAVNWINGPPAEGVVATYLIDWIRFYPYYN